MPREGFAARWQAPATRFLVFIRVHPRSSAAHICFLNFRVGREEKHIWPLMEGR
jgi:hypothetical protein